MKAIIKKIENDYFVIATYSDNQEIEQLYEEDCLCLYLPDSSNLKPMDKYTVTSEKLEEINQIIINLEARKFLNDTDWKVIRHRDQVNLGITTSLSNDEFLELLNQRQEARDKVVE